MTLNDVTLQKPNDRDTSNRLTVGRVQADMTLASLWSGHPQITELAIVRPVLNVPLLRQRRTAPAPASSNPATAAHDTNSNAPAIDRIKVTDGTIVFSNLRDRVENRIDGINADATVGADRKIKDHRQRARQRASAQIRHQGDRARPAAGAAEHSGRAHARRARPAASAAVGPGPRSGSTARW